MVRRYGGRFIYRLCGRISFRYVFGAVDMGDNMLIEYILAGVAVVMFAACLYEALTMDEGGDNK